MTKSIPLTKGYSALVDNEDYEHLSQWSWSALTLPDGSVYAYRTARIAEREAGSPRAVYMHREVLGILADRSLDADHINHNGLDNRRQNLRACHSQPQRGQPAQVSKRRPGHRNSRGCRSSSGRADGWRGSRSTAGASISATSSSELEAARAYDEAAVEGFGEYAHLNFPNDEGRGNVEGME